MLYFKENRHSLKLKNRDKDILIVGAGPSGLSLAIFLSDLGYAPTIIDKKKSISPFSKALGVNPRTLELFKDAKITDRFLSNGRKMEAINIWKGNKHLFKNQFSKINHEFAFMLIQPQKESEEILLEEVTERNIEVKYGHAFHKMIEKGEKYETTIDHLGVKQYDIVIGADGGKSHVREALQISMDGFTYDEDWEVLDVILDLPLNKDEGHIRIFDEGGMIMIRLKDDVWRIAGNMKDILNYLPTNTKVGKIIWTSNFRINHKLANTLSTHNTALIGDAAHLHSPIGARGMNLGIEDAWIVSQLIKENRLHDYTDERISFLNQTVARVNMMTMAFAGNSNMSRLLRKNIGLFRLLFPIVMPRARKFILGT